MNTARNQSGSSEASPSSQGVIVGGNEPPQSAKTELWNGSAWTETSDLNAARRDGGSGGVYASMGFFGGTGPSPDMATNHMIVTGKHSRVLFLQIEVVHYHQR